MRGAEKVYKTVSDVLPCAHIAWQLGSAPALPWAVYYLDGMSGFAADNRLLSKRNSWVVEHYWKDFDSEIEARIEAAIEEGFGPYSKSETWVDDEKCFMTVYRFTEQE